MYTVIDTTSGIVGLTYTKKHQALGGSSIQKRRDLHRSAKT